MADATTTERNRPASFYQSGVKPVWCPGCGDYGSLSAFYEMLSQMDIDPKDLCIVSGIGCSGRFSHFVKGYSFHCVHGRTLPTATGLKLARPDLYVVAVSGDGDGMAIGGGHIAHAARRNSNITWLLLDNNIYGLTKGQTSPTSPDSITTKTNPYGSYEADIDPITMFLSYGVSFVARGYSAQPKPLAEMLVRSMKHPGLAIVHIITPCVTYNPAMSFKSINEIVKPIPEDHDPKDLNEAMDLALSRNLYTGVFYENPRPTLLEKMKGIQGAAMARQGGQPATLKDLFKPLT